MSSHFPSPTCVLKLEMNTWATPAQVLLLRLLGALCAASSPLFSAVPLPKPEAQISLILFSPDTSSPGFTYRGACALSPFNSEADYNQLLNRSRGSSKYLLPTCAAAWGSLLALPFPTQCGATAVAEPGTLVWLPQEFGRGDPLWPCLVPCWQPAAAVLSPLQYSGWVRQ